MPYEDIQYHIKRYREKGGVRTSVRLRDNDALQRRAALPTPREAEVVCALLGTRGEVHDIRLYPHVLVPYSS